MTLLLLKPLPLSNVDGLLTLEGLKQTYPRRTPVRFVRIDLRPRYSQPALTHCALEGRYVGIFKGWKQARLEFWRDAMVEDFVKKGWMRPLKKAGERG